MLFKGDRASSRVCLAFLLPVTENGVDQARVFHRIPSLDDTQPAEIFTWEVLRFLVDKSHLSPEWAKRLFFWRHPGFNVHGRVRARTKKEAESVVKNMIRPVVKDVIELLLILRKKLLYNPA